MKEKIIQGGIVNGVKMLVCPTWEEDFQTEIHKTGGCLRISMNYSAVDVSYWKVIVFVSSGDYHTVGLKSVGTVVATGENDYGQCDVSNWKDIVAVSSRGTYTVGLKRDGTVVATGNND